MHKLAVLAKYPRSEHNKKKEDVFRGAETADELVTQQYIDGRV